MKIRLLGWSSIGLRSPDVTIKLKENGSLPRVSLIQMPNGAGKTTTLQMLRRTLSGTAMELSAEDIRQLARPDNREGVGEFQVDLAVDDKLVSLQTVLDFGEGIALHRTSSPAIGGLQDKWSPPSYLRPFLSEKFVNLYVFDGELANDLLRQKSSTADRAVDTLSQISVFTHLYTALDEHWKEQATVNARFTSDKQITRLHSELQEATKRLDQLQRGKQAAQARVREIAEEKATLETEVGDVFAANAVLSDQRAELDRDRERLENQIVALEGHIMDEMRDPAAFGWPVFSPAIELRASLDELKLPETASAQFFTELSKSEVCICGRPIGADEKEHIVSNSPRYLASDEQGELNAIKSALADIDQDAVDERHTNTADLMVTLNQSMVDLKETKQSIAGLAKQLGEAGVTNEVEKKQKRIEEIETYIPSLRLDLERYDQQDGQDRWRTTKSISAVAAKKQDIEDTMARVSETKELKSRITLVKAILSSAEERARSRIKQKVLESANARLENVLSDSNVRIDSIDESIRLRNQSGASVGQTLSIGYVFLLSLLEHGANSFPLVVDSPAGPLDIPRRHEIGELIPKIADQFVGFVISTEREGFVDALRKSTPSISYYTVYRASDDGSGQETEANHQGSVVPGADFFDSFHSLDDGEG